MDNVVNRKSLRSLADYIAKIPKKEFDMGQFGEQDVTEDGIPIKGCGFVGCALGHAGRSKRFKGLELESSLVERLNPGDNEPKSYLDFHVTYTNSNGVQYQDFDAAQEKFGLSYPEATYLFSGSLMGKTPKQISKRIYKWLDQTKGLPYSERAELAESLNQKEHVY